ncbi:hypothetical protein BDP55DRAFT_638195 [Colletotrichum godetiae]|uniref:Het and ankyrin domain protein n=1 Tax=Colletotrichum godetiae TaxID=1209918 RepID=A0AAJ0AAJ0_9PEZI|nr:uncharacterized protein BDP55DRAFT_638195 [Colletotrichum godetiae]KAK1658091.1 hypothetical protein BDP55DRAFT_638195 [Colletotrichum godetiae]
MPRVALSESMVKDFHPLFYEPGTQLETLPYFLNLETPTHQGDQLTTKRNDCALTRLGSLQSDQNVNDVGFPIREISSKTVGASSDHEQSLDAYMYEGTEDKGPSLTGKFPCFACPFYRNDAMRHIDCFSLRMVRIRDVKQHLRRRHAEPSHYCPTCYQKFKTEMDKSRHISDQSAGKCSPAEGGLDFVTLHAQDLLKSKVSRRATASEQWYTVWDTIFKPKPKPRPDRPSMGTFAEETISLLRTLWRHEGDQIISRSLATRQLSTRNVVYFKGIVHSVMEESFDMFGMRLKSLQSMGGSTSPSRQEKPYDVHRRHNASYDRDEQVFVTTAASSNQGGFESVVDNCLREIERNISWDWISENPIAELHFTPDHGAFTSDVEIMGGITRTKDFSESDFPGEKS